MIQLTWEIRNSQCCLKNGDEVPAFGLVATTKTLKLGGVPPIATLKVALLKKIQVDA